MKYSSRNLIDLLAYRSSCMLAPLPFLARITARLRETIGTIPFHASNGWVSLMLGLPHVPTCAPELSGPRFNFAHSHRGEIRAGFGIAAEWWAQGNKRLLILRQAAQELTSHWQQIDPDETGFTGFALLGFAASPWISKQPELERLPNAMLWLPELALWVQNGQAALIFTTIIPTQRENLQARWEFLLTRMVNLLERPIPAPLTSSHLQAGVSTPDIKTWQQLVDNALFEINQGRLQKIVIARRQLFKGQRRFDLIRLNTALGYLFPACQVINIRRWSASFVAATPERLFTQQGSWVEVDAIAGTTSRAEESAQDIALARELLISDKNLREHEIVVLAIMAVLRKYTQGLDFLDKNGPRILQLHNAQHLWSRIRGELLPEVDLFQLADVLHPTPATNGYPKTAAHDWLQIAEPFERDWYTGAAGIVTPDLTGELWVLLRCAWIQEQTAHLYAGAGIVAGSDPLSEWRETEHKISALVTALQFA